MKKLKFGTDGIRGIYGKELTEESAYRLGAVLGKRGDILIGRDNRLSSPTLARAVACGARAVGANYLSVGLTTTPALYYLLTQSGFVGAVMITASHNPPEHNGLKVFLREGKPREEECACIEKETGEVPPPRPRRFSYAEDPSLLSLYESFFREKIGSLKGVTAIVDYAGGAGYAFRSLLESLGARILPLALAESGEKVNVGCGALHPENCVREMLRHSADVAFALDGDGDRLIVVDREGRVLDGDRILYLLACRMKQAGRLADNKVALTVMSNSGVLKSLSERGITPITCAVGDSAVAETMRAEKLNLGGEQSGHVILGDLLMTGDALLVAGALMHSLLTDGPLELTPPPAIYPQVLLNLSVPDKSVAYHPLLQSLAAEIKEELTEGRVLLRASGTESVVRVMVEHPSEEKARSAAERLGEAVLRFS